jgi:hypothetical protein
MMTLLDDFETRYKLLGLQVVNVMLQRIPKDLLKRTGVDSLLFLVSIVIMMNHLLTHAAVAPSMPNTSP